MPDLEDRRKTGVHGIRITDGNGDHLDLITATAKKTRVIAGAVTAVLVLLGMVFGAVRLGVVAEARQVIRVEALSEDGIIHRVIHECAEEYIDEMQGVLQDDLDDFDKRIGGLENGQIAIVTQQEDHQQELKMLIQRAINEED